MIPYTGSFEAMKLLSHNRIFTNASGVDVGFKHPASVVIGRGHNMIPITVQGKFC